MKKTLFLSAILGAALCSSAFAEDHTYTGTNNTRITLTGYSAQDTVTFQMGSSGTTNWFDSAQSTAAKILISDDASTTDVEGLNITNGNQSYVTFSGAVSGNGAIQKTGAGTNLNLNFTGNVTEYTGNITLNAGNAFVLRFGSTSNNASDAGTAPASSATKGVSGTGVITFKNNGNSTIVYNYASSENPVYITNEIKKNGGTSKVQFLGGASYVLTKNAAIDEMTLGADTQLTIASDAALTLGTTVNVNINETAKTEGNGFGSIVIDRQIASGTVNASTVTTWKVNGTTDASLSYDSTTNTLTGDSRATTNYYINDAASWDGTLTGATTATVNIEGEMGISNNGYTLDTLTINRGTVNSNRNDGTGIIKGDIVINGGGKLAIVQGGKDAFGYNGNATKSITLTGTDAGHKAVLDLSFNDVGGTTTMSANIVMNGYAEISGTRGFNTFYYDGTRAGSITVSGTNNVISSELSIRKASTLTVKEGGELLISGTISRFPQFDGALTKTGAGTLTITGNITGGSIIGDGAKTIIRDNTITGGTFQNVTFTNAKVNGTITLNNITGDGKLQNALNGLSVAETSGASSTINLGGGEYTFNAETTVNAHQLVFGGNTEINGHGYDSDGHIITLSNGASINTGANELKIESEATLKLTNGTSVTSGSVVLGHNTVTNPGFLSMAGGSITTGFIKSNAGYAASDNTFTMTGGTLTFTKPASETVMVDGPDQDGEGNPIPVEQTNTYNAIDGVTATITGGTLSTENAAWKIDNADVTLGAVTISGANAATLSHVKLGSGTKIHTNTTVEDGITSVSQSSDKYAFLVESNSTLTFTGADYDLTDAGAGIGLQAGSSVVVDTDSSLTLKTFVYSSGNQWTTNNGSATVKAGATLNIEGNGFRDAFLSSMELQGALNLATDAKLHLSTLTGSETASLAVNGTMEVVNAGATTVGSLTLGSGATLTLGNHDVNLTTTNLEVTGDGATINANLVVNGGTITFADNATLTMGCEVTIGTTDTVTVVLTQEMVDAVATTGRYDLFTSVETATLGNIVFVAADGATLKDGGTYSLAWDGNKIYVAPEPATATLSLLALAALCARRKRH